MIVVDINSKGENMKKFALYGLCILIVLAGYLRFTESDNYIKFRIDYLGGNNEVINEFNNLGSTINYVNSFEEFHRDKDICIIDGQKVSELKKDDILAFLQTGKILYFINLKNTKDFTENFLMIKDYGIYQNSNKSEILIVQYHADNELTMQVQGYSDYRDLYRIFSKNLSKK
jgi:hypothetical protein